MLIKDHGLLDTNYEGDNFVFSHFQDVAPTLREVEKLKLVETDGYSQDRSQRHIGRIPEIEFLKHPEWMQDGRLLLKWLQSDEGRQYMIHKVNSGKSAQVIVK